MVAETGGELPLEPFTVQCPRCGDTYVAELAPEDEPWDLEAQEWEAVTRLHDECPDHAHVFAVGL